MFQRPPFYIIKIFPTRRKQGLKKNIVVVHKGSWSLTILSSCVTSVELADFLQVVLTSAELKAKKLQFRCPAVVQKTVLCVCACVCCYSVEDKANALC